MYNVRTSRSLLVVELQSAPGSGQARAPIIEVPAMPHLHYQMETAIVKHCRCLTPYLPCLPSRGSGVVVCFVQRLLQRRPTRSCRCRRRRRLRPNLAPVLRASQQWWMLWGKRSVGKLDRVFVCNGCPSQVIYEPQVRYLEHFAGTYNSSIHCVSP
ncbi:hypothetical protein LZ30DRAFT_735355 [Colletotrichum cereale]|nr:hypothetical protein LZ30DRAFT_735355 [Colletotrichum cereale]